MKRKEQKRNNARLDHVVSSGLGSGVSMVNGIVNGINRNAIIAFGGSGKVYDQFMTTPFTPEATWTGADKIDTSKQGLIDRAQEYALEQALIANGMDADLAKTVASTTNGKIKAKKAKKEERTKAIESTAQTAIAVAGMVVAPGSTAGMLLNLTSTALSTAIASRTGGSQGVAAVFLNSVVNSVMPVSINGLPAALNITYDRENGWGGGVAVGGSKGNASLQLSQRGGAQVNVGTTFGSVNYNSANGSVGVNANLTGLAGLASPKIMDTIKEVGLQGLGGSIGWNSATGASASVSYGLGGGNSVGLNFNNRGSSITGTTQGTNLFTSSSDGSFSINTNFANDRLTNLAVDQAQVEFDKEMERRITEAEDKALGQEKSKLTGKDREDALKKIGWGMGDENEAKDTSDRNKIWGEFTDGLNNLATAIGVGGLQATGASGFVDKDGKFHPRTCFTAGTKIRKLKDSVVASEVNIDLLEVNAELEELVNIENVKAGNFVRSWNEKTGKMGYKKVLNTFERVAEGIYNLELSNGEIIQPTWNHPFWVLFTSPNLSGDGLSSTTNPLLRGKGTGDYPLSLAGKWVETKDLKVGDRLLAANGDIVTVDDIAYTVGQVTVYNFEVADNHTYFVGELGVLVHNTSCADALAYTLLNGKSPERLTLGQIEDRYSWFGMLRIPIEALMNGIAGNGFNRDYQVSSSNVSFDSRLDSSGRNKIVSTLNNMTTSVYFDVSDDGKLSMIKKTGAKEEYPIAERLITSLLTNPRHQVEFSSVDNPYAKGSGHSNACIGCPVRISSINFLPDKDSKHMQFYSVNGVVTPQYMTDRTMTLAHELIHAHRSMIGVELNDAAQRSILIDTPLYYPSGVKRGYIQVSQEEIETTGKGVEFRGTLTNGFRGEFSENILRQERGLPIRTTYASMTAKRNKEDIKP